MGPPLTMTAGMFTRSMAISIPGVTLSQLGIITMPSKGWACAIISTESAMISRLASEYFIPVWFMAIPSHTPIVPNAMGVPPAILMPALTASKILSRWIWPGMISLWAWAMPIKGLLISSLVYPMAFIRERWGALSIPFFMRSLRIIGFLFCSYYTNSFILLSKCTNKCLIVPTQLCSMRRNMVWKNLNFQRWLVSVEESTQSSVGCQEK